MAVDRHGDPGSTTGGADAGTETGRDRTGSSAAPRGASVPKGTDEHSGADGAATADRTASAAPGEGGVEREAPDGGTEREAI